jgi:hypothetical protein
VPQELAEQPPFAAGASFNTGNCIGLTSKVTFTKSKSTGRANVSILFYLIDLMIYLLWWMRRLS